MKELRELVQIMGKKQLENIKRLEFPFGEESKMEKLYDFVIDNPEKNESDAISYLYPNKKKDTTQQSNTYRHLRKDLEDRLLTMLTFVYDKQIDYWDYRAAYYGCWKKWTAVKVLVGNNAYTSAIKLTKKILKNAERYEFTDLQIQAYELLRYHAAKCGKEKKFNDYNDKLNKYRGIAEKESQAEEYYLMLNMQFAANRSAKDSVAQKAGEYHEIVAAHMEKYTSYRLHLYGYLIELRKLGAKNEYEDYIKVCKRAVAFFEEKKEAVRREKTKDDGKYYNTIPALHIFYHHLLIGYVFQRNIEEGMEWSEKALALIQEGHVNWFKHHELLFYLNMHSEKYQEAYQVYRTVTTHSRFKFLEKNVQDIWDIFKAYLHYLIKIGKIKTEEEDRTFNNVHLGRFLKQTSMYTKDKTGMNISILVIRMLLFLAKKDYAKTSDRAEAMRQYIESHLKEKEEDKNVIKKETYRSYKFIKMLLKIPHAGFDRDKVEKRAAVLYQDLQGISLEAVGNEYEIEIIPYEQLWGLVINNLEDDF